MRSEIVVCPWNEFWQHYSPWIPPEAVVQQGASILETANILNGGEWAEDVDPASGPNENVGFESLQKIARKLEDTKITDRKAFYRMVHRPYQTASSTIPSGNHIPDGYFYPIKECSNDPTAALELRHAGSMHQYKLKNEKKSVHDVSLTYLWCCSWLI